MTEKDIINAYVRIREIDNTIPDEVLDFMKQSSIDTLKLMKYGEKRREMKSVVESPNSKFKWKKDSSHYRSWKYGMRDLEGAYELEMKYRDNES